MRIAGTVPAELPLAPGVHGLVGDRQGGVTQVDDVQAANVCFCVDRRGVWLTVGEGAGSVHVNGRPVQRMAMLRIGDTVHADDAEMVLAGAPRPSLPPMAPTNASSARREHDPRMVLRGLGGRHHGRSFTLDRPRLVGSDDACDIRIDDPPFSGRHCSVGMEGGLLVLRDLGSEEGSIVNGNPVRDAVLRPGDQIVFDAQQRFAVEAPAGDIQRGQASPFSDDELAADPADSVQQALGRSARRLPWLLLAAILIAAALAALLLFGTSG